MVLPVARGTPHTLPKRDPRPGLKLRQDPAFSLPAFHGAVLDRGSLPMPTLARSITGWLDRAD